MAKKALLVGINYPGTQHALKGCVNDVMAMSDILTKSYGFAAGDKRMLTDASATTANILERLKWLVSGAQPGDVLYFHFSGHGSQVVDKDYDTNLEPDKLDEIICPVDLDWRTKVITDDQLKSIFHSVPNGVSVNVVLDCCHSGGGLDQINAYISNTTTFTREHLNPDVPIRDKFIPMPVDIANRGVGLDLPLQTHADALARDINVNTMLISGCRPNQTSADAWFNNKYMGALTYYMTQTLAKFNYKISYQRLVDETAGRLVRYGYSQRPELNGSSLLYSREFLSPM